MLLHVGDNIDVSTIKELARRWAPAIFESVKKKETHQALDDVLESIDELKHYKSSVCCIASLSSIVDALTRSISPDLP
jgi:oligoribonuclease (3'-5' exoribonuclease)